MSCINIHAKRICFLRIDFDFCFLEKSMWVEGRGTRCGKFSLISTIYTFQTTKKSFKLSEYVQLLIGDTHLVKYSHSEEVYLSSKYNPSS